MSVLSYKEKPKKLENVRREQHFWFFVFLFMSLGFKIMNRTYLVAKAEAKGLIGRFRHKCDGDFGDDIKINLQEIEWERVDWICLAQTGKHSELL